jgi:putative DNA methylase
MSRPEARAYSRLDCVSFRKTDESFGGLSNMAPGFPLEVNGIRIRTSEALYQACRFPHLPEVQRLIIGEGSPMTAKMKSKPYRAQSRADWDVVRVKVMKWCLRVKLAQNWEKFGSLLLATGDKPIVEDSRKDDFWGAKPLDNVLVGGNVLGRLLMELREQLRGPQSDFLRRVEPPPIPNFVLYDRPIGVIVTGSHILRAVSDPITSATSSSDQSTLVVSLDEPRAPSASNAFQGHNWSVGHRTDPMDGALSTRGTVSEYPKRLIEVDLPIKKISAHARREKSIRHGHISTLHIWWARRPLAACRAVILAALWPDPADPHCPERFRREAAAQMKALRDRLGGTRRDWNNPLEIRAALLDFIADFANWDNSNRKDYLEASRVLVQTAHEALGGTSGTRPLVMDPFAGGGAIPLEALRVGADAFASDLNPVAVLLNKVILEYIPKYGHQLADEVGRWGEWIEKEAEKTLAGFYPKDSDGATPIAYLWARTVRCEGPGCGAEVPLLRTLWLAKKGDRSIALRLVPDRKKKRVEFEIVNGAKDKDVGEGTVRRGSATCPVCGYTTTVERVRIQLCERLGGSHDARLISVVTVRNGHQGRCYRMPTTQDFDSARQAMEELTRRKRKIPNGLSLVPDEEISVNELRRISLPIYGMSSWGDLFTPRQALTLSTLAAAVRAAGEAIARERGDSGLAAAVETCLALAVDRQADSLSSLVTWTPGGEFQGHTMARQALPMVWDFAEVNPFCDSSGNWLGAIEWIRKVCEAGAIPWVSFGHAESASATRHPLPDDSVHAVITDPPYYDAVPYAYLSDFFYVWLRRSLANLHQDLLASSQVPKEAEIVVDRPHQRSASKKDIAFYECELAKAFADARRVLRPDGIGTVVFASKTTSSWEAILNAIVDSGWVITASWPIDTEREARIAAQGQARLGSSVHIVCRPREAPAGNEYKDAVGDWRDILSELPKRIHDWMPRLAKEGVVGADAIFSCLGPALEIFSRYSSVEKTSGDRVLLKEYLEHVWAAVAKEALAMIFADADATGFEEDARLTAMWLWTLSTGSVNGSDSNEAEANAPAEADEDEIAGKSKIGGFVLEYDAARKIAQGLGAHLEVLSTLVEVKGSTARLLPVAERTRSLFQKGESASPMGGRKSRKRTGQLSMGFVADLEEAEERGGWGDTGAPQKGETVLDRVHQAMILFGTGRGEALKRFLVDDGVGRDDRFWRLAQALSALYPTSTDEKRWVDGVLARKKGLGF